MPDQTMPSRNDMLALEKSYWDAMKKKDGTKSAALSGETTLVTGAQGVTSIAKTKMGKMTEEGKWTLHSYALDDVEIVTPTADVAIIAYTVTQTVTMGGKTEEMKAADCSTWVRGPDGWQCHAHSETFLKQ